MSLREGKRWRWKSVLKTISAARFDEVNTWRGWPSRLTLGTNSVCKCDHKIPRWITQVAAHIERNTSCHTSSEESIRVWYRLRDFFADRKRTARSPVTGRNNFSPPLPVRKSKLFLSLSLCSSPIDWKKLKKIMRADFF